MNLTPKQSIARSYPARLPVELDVLDGLSSDRESLKHYVKIVRCFHDIVSMLSVRALNLSSTGIGMNSIDFLQVSTASDCLLNH